MIEKELLENLKTVANTTEAEKMEAYMRNLFPFLGIKAPIRKKVFSAWYKHYKTDAITNVRTITFALYKQPYRELHYCAMELFQKACNKKYLLDDHKLITELITTHSWWDTVDFIAKHILGNYLLQYPEMYDTVIDSYSTSKNMWLNRSAILYQLGYKDKTNKETLFRECIKHAPSNEFFIQKAIGWALREYAKTNPTAVITFVNSHDLKPLSKKEALKHF